MRKRGRVFKDFKEVGIDANVVAAVRILNINIKLVMELLADLRVNTSDDPKKLEEGGGN